MKKCSKCKELKELDQFNKNKNRKDGRNPRCRDCHRIHYTDNKARYAELGKLWRNSNPLRAWAVSTVKSHRGRGYIIELTVDELLNFIADKKICNYCGRELDWGIGNKGKICSNSPSLDRVNNEMIISLNNIKILCHQCNRTKGGRTHREYIEHCQKMVDKFSNKEDYSFLLGDNQWL